MPQTYEQLQDQCIKWGEFLLALNEQLEERESLLSECLAVFDAEPDDATKLIPAVRAKIEALKGEKDDTS